MRISNTRYWLCQIFGWGTWGLTILYFNLVAFADQFNERGGKKEYFISMAIFLGLGILITHTLRYFIKKANWLKFSFNKIALFFILSLMVTSIMLFYLGDWVEKKSGFSYDEFLMNQQLEKAKILEAENDIATIAYYKKDFLKDSTIAAAVSEIKKSTGWYKNTNGKWIHKQKSILLNIYANLLLIGLWLLIYIVYHYVEKNRKDQLDKVTLEKTVKELELKTIKSHINPHFIFNSLNSIRALVDENPQRARQAITELSNILRSSMQAEKAETVSLSREMDIVTDYLALEQMRFEERLRIEMDIDENTLEQLVPPMMLQTLVENAIKHGIGKQINGGVVRIGAHLHGNNLELLVQNTGQLNKNISSGGFGIKSTQDRLNLMYQGKAAFEIKDLDNNLVQSKVMVPISVLN
jgi:two-component system, LytTR family, sensor kinase